MSDESNYHSEPHHQELGSEFFDTVKAAEFPKSILRFRNQRHAEQVGLGKLTDEQWINHFAKFQPLKDNLPEPLALRYHGHQFRTYNPDLGDGRGFLFAQLRERPPSSSETQYRLLDLGTKGSGQTPWSRSGDGKLTLKGAMREVLATEMLEALGVNTSKTFSVIETGENLERNDEPSPTRSAVLVRLNHSHIRFGSFQRPAVQNKPDLVEQLLRHSVKYYYPEIDSKLPSPELAAKFLEAVTENTAALCAQWMIAGFVHGVLNTDNMNITGESFDYGPYRFLPHFDPSFTAAYFDHSGLYSFGRQPESCIWNLEQLASCLALLIPEKVIETDPEVATEQLRNALGKFVPRFNADFFKFFCSRLGVDPSSLQQDSHAEAKSDAPAKFLQAAFEFLKASQAGYDQFYFDWYGGMVSEKRATTSPIAELYEREDFMPFLQILRTLKPLSGVEQKLDGFYFKRRFPTSMLIDEIEAIWSKIATGDDWSDFYEKIEEVRGMGKVYGFAKY